VARRVSLPAADDLFRPTHPQQQSGQQTGERGERPEDRPQDRAPKSVRAVPDAPDAPEETSSAVAGTTRKPSGRVRHDEKMTVYITSDELLDLEHARLALRRSHGMAVDRGRLVREAVALVLADFEEHGDDSALVRRLTSG
jgi:hypothetical protein